jgi:hypothetical protein
LLGELSDIKSGLNTRETKCRECETLEFSVEQRLGILQIIKQDIVRIQRVRNDSKSHIEDSRLDSSILQKRTLIGKLNDESYLIQLDSKRNANFHQDLVDRRRTIESELEELERFPVPEIGDQLSDPETRKETLVALEDEYKRLSNEVNRIREIQFRARVKY